MTDIPGADARALRTAERAERTNGDRFNDYGGKLASTERMVQGLAARSTEPSDRRPGAEDATAPAQARRDSRGGLFGPLGGLSRRGARWYSTDAVKLGDRSSSRPSDPNLRQFALGQLDRLQPGLGSAVRAQQDRLYGTVDAPVSAGERRARLTTDLSAFLAHYPSRDQLPPSTHRPDHERNR